MSPIHLGPGPLAPEIVNAVIEIPTGSRIKYEIDHETGLVHVDRVLVEVGGQPGIVGGSAAERQQQQKGRDGSDFQRHGFLSIRCGPADGNAGYDS